VWRVMSPSSRSSSPNKMILRVCSLIRMNIPEELNGQCAKSYTQDESETR
jgi:hypothetical protein